MPSRRIVLIFVGLAGGVSWIIRQDPDVRFARQQQRDQAIADEVARRASEAE